MLRNDDTSGDGVDMKTLHFLSKYWSSGCKYGCDINNPDKTKNKKKDGKTQINKADMPHAIHFSFEDIGGDSGSDGGGDSSGDSSGSNREWKDPLICVCNFFGFL